jgi:hypothetical protein
VTPGSHTTHHHLTLYSTPQRSLTHSLTHSLTTNNLPLSPVSLILELANHIRTMKITQFIVALAPAFLAVVNADILPTSDLQDAVDILAALQTQVENVQAGITAVNDKLNGYDGWENQTVAWMVGAIQADFTQAYTDIEGLIEALVKL